ncbi:MAG: hypothetical protein FWD02_02875 [Bacteroidales bacterium]|nr:hypothetical protein [Bacteroidales bacterium]
MTQKTKKETENRTVNLKIRLTPKEHALFLENIAKHGYGNQSSYIRHCLFKKEFTLTTYDKTARKTNIAINDFTTHVKIVCTNFNQITRFIQASHIYEDAEILLEKGNKQMDEILKYTTEVYKILAKVEQYYDSKNQPNGGNTEPSKPTMPQWLVNANNQMNNPITVGNKTLNLEQIERLRQGKEVVVEDVLHNGGKCRAIVSIEGGQIKKKFVYGATSK